VDRRLVQAGTVVEFRFHVPMGGAAATVRLRIRLTAPVGAIVRRLRATAGADVARPAVPGACRKISVATMGMVPGAMAST
jgi:hypothetical protein